MTLCQCKGSPYVPKLQRPYSWKVETVSKGLFCHSSIVTEHFTHNPSTASKWRKTLVHLGVWFIVISVQILPGLAARVGPSRAQRAPLSVGFLSRLFGRRHDIQHNDTQHNDIQHNDTQHNDTQHNSKLNMTLIITTVSRMLLCCEAECHLCCHLLTMLSAASKPIMLSVIMPNVVMLSVVMLNVVAPFGLLLTCCR
jgi:hypothetical protein